MAILNGLVERPLYPRKRTCVPAPKIQSLANHHDFPERIWYLDPKTTKPNPSKGGDGKQVN